MLIKKSVLEQIRSGRISVVFRNLKRPTVRSGGTLKTSIGVCEIVDVSEIAPDNISTKDVREAGYEDMSDLLADIPRRPKGSFYRIEIRFAGPDPRQELTETTPDEQQLGEIITKLRKWDDKGGGDRWATNYLRLITSRPGTLAATLAESMHVDKMVFKRRVRRLKNLGLTESLKVGYRISQLGRHVLEALKNRR